MRIIYIFILFATITTNSYGAKSQGSNAIGTESIEDSAAERPDILNCNKLSWLDSCEQINIQLKEKPNSHVRIIDKSGYEHNFPPGTPSAVMTFLIERTPEAASAFADYLEASVRMSTEAAMLYQAELKKRGGYIEGTSSANDRLSSSRIKVGSLNIERVKMYVIYDSTCHACQVFIPVVGDLQKKYPDLFISILQLDDNLERLKEIKSKHNLRGVILSGEDRDRIVSKVKVTPTTWFIVDKKTHVKTGVLTVSKIEEIISEVSNDE